MATIEPHLRTLVEDYLSWLRARITLKALPGIGGGWFALTTPYLDKHNDFIEIYLKEDGDQILMSDDGYTFDELETSGCSINTAKRRELLAQSLKVFGITEKDGALTSRSGKDEFPVRKHLFLQGLLAIGDMMYLSSPTVTSVFKEDVEHWLEEQDIRFAPTIKLTGRSGFDHVFDFLIPKSRLQPERLLKVFTKPDRERAEGMVFSWVDTREARLRETQAYAILNDAEPVPPAVIGALRAYEIIPVPWGTREDYKDKLAA